jgi:hypothetical protein
MSVLPKDFNTYYDAVLENGAEILASSNSDTVYLDVPMGTSYAFKSGSMTPKSVIIFKCHGNMFALFRSTLTNVFFKSDKWYIKPCSVDSNSGRPTIYVCKKVENFIVKNVSDIKKFINNNAKLKLIESSLFRFKMFESIDEDYLDISKLKNIDLLEYGEGYKFYRAVDTEQIQELLKIWPDIKVPLKFPQLLLMYIQRGYTFYFYVTRSKKEFLFFEVDDHNDLKVIHNSEYKCPKITEVPEQVLSIIKTYCNVDNMMKIDN